MSRSWTKPQQAFIDWLALPKYERIPPTQEMLADTLGLNRKTLARWKKLDGLWDAVADKAEWYLYESLPGIYGALSREADKGSYQHIKLSLELTGRYVERKEITGADGGPIQVRWDDPTDSD